jgi:membrane protein required for beta-lactamase induction
VIGIPVAQILRRTGFSRWLALLILIPLVGIVALWIFAFGAWRVEFGNVEAERERNRQLDNWSDAEKETFRNLMNKPRA